MISIILYLKFIFTCLTAWYVNKKYHLMISNLGTGGIKLILPLKGGEFPRAMFLLLAIFFIMLLSIVLSKYIPLVGLCSPMLWLGFDVGTLLKCSFFSIVFFSITFNFIILFYFSAESRVVWKEFPASNRNFLRCRNAFILFFVITSLLESWAYFLCR